MPTQDYLVMNLYHLSSEICYIGKNLQTSDILLHVSLLRLSSVHHFLYEEDNLLSEV
jgi:hypothetical protein